MKFNQWMLAGIASAVFVAGAATAQSKKPAVKKPASGSVRSTTAAKPGTGGTITSTQDSISYSIGLFMAQNLKQQGITDLNNALLVRGLQDALQGQPTQLTQEQAGRVMNNYMQKQMAVRNAEGMKASAENKKIGTAFLTENKAKAGVVTTASGYSIQLKKQELVPNHPLRIGLKYTTRVSCWMAKYLIVQWNTVSPLNLV